MNSLYLAVLCNFLVRFVKQLGNAAKGHTPADTLKGTTTKKRDPFGVDTLFRRRNTYLSNYIGVGVYIYINLEVE